MLSDEGLAVMNDTLRFAASDPRTSPQEAQILLLIADGVQRPAMVQ